MRRPQAYWPIRLPFLPTFGPDEKTVAPSPRFHAKRVMLGWLGVPSLPFDGPTPKGATVSTQTPGNMEDLQEMGPVDYVVIEWPDRQPTGEAAPIVADLVDRGIIRVLDLAFITKAEDGTVAALDIEKLGEVSESFKLFEGASSGLLGDDDVQEAAKALEPGTSAALLVFENSWAAPFASAIRRSGGQLVANGRIPVQAVLAALEAAEKADSSTTTS